MTEQKNIETPPEQPAPTEQQAGAPDVVQSAEPEPPAPVTERKEAEIYLMSANEVASMLHIKQCMAYKIIRECNAELEAAGKLVIRGKVLRKYLLKKLEV